MKLEEHFSEYDFIWSSPPCPSHSRIRNEAGIGRGQNEPIIPDMKLYGEIIFLQHMEKMGFYKGKYCVENVISYYPPLVPPQKMSNHYFWCNFMISPIDLETRGHFTSNENLSKLKGFDLKKYKGIDERKTLRNCVEPETGKHILDCMLKPNTLL